jgi:hypothetical protein
MSLPSFEKGSDDDFVRDIMDCYPSFLEIETGSLAFLHKSLDRFAPRNITMDGQDKLFDFIQALQVQVEHLISGKMSSNEAIATFLGKLDAEFVNAVWTRLDMQEVFAGTGSKPDHVALGKAEEFEHSSFEKVVSVAKMILQGAVARNDYNSDDCLLEI